MGTVNKQRILIFLFPFSPHPKVMPCFLLMLLKGMQILVAPILEKGLSKPSVYLPADKWYYFYDEKPIEEGAVTIAQAAINQIPFYKKEGSFIINNGNLTSTNTAGITNDELSVNYYYSKLPSNCDLYEDVGINKNAIKNNQYQIISFKATNTANKLTYKINTSEGDFKSKLLSRKLKLFLHNLPISKEDLYINGIFIEHINKNKEVPAGVYSFSVNYNSKPIIIEIK